MKRGASCSDVQQAAEIHLVSELSLKLGKSLRTQSLNIDHAKFTVDGFYEDDKSVILAEVWAHIGQAKSAQRNKVLGDILKLALIGARLRKTFPHKIIEPYLVFADEKAANVVRGKGWAGLAAKEFGIDFLVITPSDEKIRLIKQAQIRQDIRFVEDCNEDEL